MDIKETTLGRLKEGSLTLKTFTSDNEERVSYWITLSGAAGGFQGHVGLSCDKRELEAIYERIGKILRGETDNG